VELTTREETFFLVHQMTALYEACISNGIRPPYCGKRLDISILQKLRLPAHSYKVCARHYFDLTQQSTSRLTLGGSNCLREVSGIRLATSKQNSSEAWHEALNLMYGKLYLRGCTVAHKIRDPCFRVFLIEAGVITFVAHCTFVTGIKG